MMNAKAVFSAPTRIMLDITRGPRIIHGPIGKSSRCKAFCQKWANQQWCVRPTLSPLKIEIINLRD
jgi:hypothetical protein